MGSLWGAGDIPENQMRRRFPPCCHFSPTNAEVDFFRREAWRRDGVRIPRAEAVRNLEGHLFFKAFWGRFPSNHVKVNV
jgi:hypothetical protein